MSEIESTQTEKLKLIYEHLSLENAYKLVNYYAGTEFMSIYSPKRVQYSVIPEPDTEEYIYRIEFGPLVSEVTVTNDVFIRSGKGEFNRQILTELHDLIKKDLNID